MSMVLEHYDNVVFEKFKYAHATPVLLAAAQQYLHQYQMQKMRQETSPAWGAAIRVVAEPHKGWYGVVLDEQAKVIIVDP